MNISAYRDEIKLKLTGQVLELEISDATIDLALSAALREIQRYIDTTKLLTIPYTNCINLAEFKVSSVSRIFRTEGYNITGQDGTSQMDPMYLGMWQVLSGNGTLYNITDWTYNYASWNTALQLRNTISTDLTFRFDKDSDNLYINCGFDKPNLITIEYIPQYTSVEEVKSDFWIDKILNLALALTKQMLGRIRTRYKQLNPLWEQDGERLLAEADAELADIRNKLDTATQLVYPID